ncbi:MAG: MTAP family purine nucleoside phosphorylase [Eubacterium limosum]|nr:MTAP family purine nucleoside phosphorylase [Eubacterium limosum]
MLYYKADIGVIGGSGLYELYPDVKKIEVDTPYGKTSDAISLVTVGDKKVAFMPRHGKDHTLNPSEINYRANIDAFAQLGIRALISPCCVGSLRPEIEPGNFVVTDQFINMTSGRKDTFNETPNVVHLSSADPYDPGLRQIALEEAGKLGIKTHDGGTVVVVNGPRFSTRAESRMFAMMGADVVNMTQYPEGYLCMEKGIPVVNIALITDYDAGLEGRPDIKPVQAEDVVRVLEDNNDRVKQLIFRMIERI